MPRSKTATDCDVFAVISLAIKRPVQPPPMTATSTGLRLVIETSLAFLFRDPCSKQFSPYCHAARTLSRSPGTYSQTEPGEFNRDSRETCRSFAGFARLVPGVVFGFEAVVLE